MFLFYATTGLRLSEGLTLKKAEIDFGQRMIIPRNAHSTYETKRTCVTFYNEECEVELRRYLKERGEDGDERLFAVNKRNLEEGFREISKQSGVKITPKMLREWFCCEMGEKGVADRYVDAFCGRIPKSVLARNYTDYSPSKLRVVYEQAGLKVLD
ncbi:MAG: site-specific integrase [Thaumarchaeota archaeon]|nr:site-specific integrase [Nitrososphaerota archaeon]